MIYFRGQTITHGDQEAFSRRFGRFAEDAYTKGVPGHPDVQPLIKEKDQKIGVVFGAGWHAGSQRPMSAGTCTRGSMTTTTFAVSSTARPLRAKRRCETASRPFLLR